MYQCIEANTLMNGSLGQNPYESYYTMLNWQCNWKPLVKWGYCGG